MQYTSEEAAMMNQKQKQKQDCLPSTPQRRESCSIASAGVATFHDDCCSSSSAEADHHITPRFVKLDRLHLESSTNLSSRRESLQLDQLKRVASCKDKSLNSWHSSLGSSLSSVFSSIRSLNIVDVPTDLDHDQAEDYHHDNNELAFPRLGMRQLQWQQRNESSSGGLQPPKIPMRRSSWNWKKSSLHSNATPCSSAGTISGGGRRSSLTGRQSRRSSLRSSITSWTPSRYSRRSSSGSISTKHHHHTTPEEEQQARYYCSAGSGEDTMPLPPWRRGSIAASIQVERILEGGEFEEEQGEGSSSFNFGFSKNDLLHQEDDKDANEEIEDEAAALDDDDEAPAARCSETTQKITNTLQTQRPLYKEWDDDDDDDHVCELLPLEEPKLVVRESAVTVKANNYSDDDDSRNDCSKDNKCRWASSRRMEAFARSSSSRANHDVTTTTTTAATGTATTNCGRDQVLSIPIRLESAHTITSGRTTSHSSVRS